MMLRVSCSVSGRHEVDVSGRTVDQRNASTTINAQMRLLHCVLCNESLHIEYAYLILYDSAHELSLGDFLT